VSLDYIRAHYDVPAVQGGRIRFTWNQWTTSPDGTICGANGQYLAVSFDDGEVGLLHPTWEVVYLPERRTATCTGLTASWCPIHGDCTCPDCSEALDDTDCRLHRATSTHPGVAR
jgi:hypothetical protein